MKNRYIFILISLFFLLDTIIFSSGFEGWVIDGDNVSFEGEVFKVSVSANSQKLILTSNNTERMQVVLELEKPFESQGFSYLYSEKKDINEDYYKTHNITGIHDGLLSKYQYNLLIERPLVGVSIERTLVEKNIVPLEIFNLTITLKNSGDFDITGDYLEELPVYYKKIGRLVYMIQEAEPREYWGYEIPGWINWRGQVKPGESVVLIQELQLVGSVVGNDNIDFMSGRFTYEFLGETLTVESGELSPVYDYPLKASIIFNDQNIMVDDETSAIIRLENDVEEKVTVDSMKVYISELAAVTDTDMSKEDDHYEWNGNVGGGGVEEFQIDIMPIKTGNVTILAFMDTKYKTIRREIEFGNGIIAEIDLPLVEMEVPEIAESNEEITPSFLVDNDGNEYDFYDIGINITSDLFEDMHYIYKSLKSGSTVSKELNFRSPWVDTRMSFPINMTVHFESVYDEMFNLTVIKEMKVNKADFVPDLSMELDRYEFNVTDNTSIYNNLYIYLNLSHNTDASINYAKIRFDLLGKKYYLIPSPEVLASQVSHYEKVIKVMKNNSEEKAIMHAYIKYIKGDEVFFLQKEFTVDLTAGMAEDDPVKPIKNGNSTSVSTKPGPVEPLPPEEEDPLFGFNLRMMIISSSIILFIFFLIVFIIFISKRKKKLVHDHDKFFLDIEKKYEKKPKGNKPRTKDIKQEKKKEIRTASPDPVPSPTTDLEILEKYISDSSIRGMHKEEIKRNLMGAGWLDDVIEVFLK